jgi:hypothetical protein
VAFTFAGPTFSGHIDESEAILFDMIRRLGLRLPLLASLDEDFYESPRIAPEKVAELRHEALQVLRGIFAEGSVRPNLFERVLAAQTPAFHEGARDLKPWDPERCLASLVAVCDDALEHHAGINCYSD